MVEAAVIVVLGMLVWAIIEDYKQPRAPVRFSLRTLLIATTVIAVVLGLVAWSMK